MKKIISGLSIFCAIAISAQEAIQFQELPFKDIIAKSQEGKEIGFIDAYASPVWPMQNDGKNVFTQKAVSDYYNTNFINARFDMEKGEGRDIASKFGVRSYPTYLFLNGEGELVSRNTGYMEESLFVAMAQDINSPRNKKDLLKTVLLAVKRPGILINIHEV